MNGAEGTSIAAVVVTYNRKDLLCQCLSSLLAQTYPIDEIIVVDNASVDGTDRMVSENFPQIMYMRLPENIGGAGGFHKGMQLAYERGNHWIWVMDDDAIPEKNALENLISFVGNGSINAYLSLAIDSKDKASLCWPIKTRRGTIYTLNELNEMQLTETLEVDRAPFVGLLVHKDIISHIGLPRSDYFIMCDDVEYSFRMRSAGYSIKICPKSYIYHPRADMIFRVGNFKVGRKSTVKHYYSLRNCLYTKMVYYSCFRFLTLSIPESLARAVLYVFFSHQGTFFERIRLSYKAFRDAFKGDLGKKI